MAYRTTLDLVPLDWTEHSSICYPWWPKAIVFPDGESADSGTPIERRCWTTHFMGVHPFVIELQETGVYLVLYQPCDYEAVGDSQNFDTLSDAQDHVAIGLLGTVAELVTISAERIEGRIE